jgi:cytochrome c553
MNVSQKNWFIYHFVTITLMVFSTSSIADTDIKTLMITCNACHGDLGVSKENKWPNLAGQKEGYLLSQLKAFKNKSRKSELMTDVISNLTETDLNRIARYYSSLPFIKPAASHINKAGENVRSACISCHGMQGKTVNNIWPNLAGQNKEYLLKQLRDFNSKKRKSMIMNVIASELNEQQMKDVAEYYEQNGSNK